MSGVPAIWEAQIGRLRFRVSPRKNMRPYLKNNLKSKKGWRYAQVVECLPSKCKALSSNPSTAKKERCIIFAPSFKIRFGKKHLFSENHVQTQKSKYMA
jgi:hypothetical protein